MCGFNCNNTQIDSMVMDMQCLFYVFEFHSRLDGEERGGIGGTGDRDSNLLPHQGALGLNRFSWSQHSWAAISYPIQSSCKDWCKEPGLSPTRIKSHALEGSPQNTQGV